MNERSGVMLHLPCRLGIGRLSAQPVDQPVPDEDGLKADSCHQRGNTPGQCLRNLFRDDVRT